MKWRHALFAVPLFFYCYTAIRVPGWLDASLLTYYAGKLQLSSWVNHHNLFTILGHTAMAIFRGVDPHYLLVLMCALFGAVTVHLIFLVGLEITKPMGAIIGALALMFSHSLWWHSTMVEVYSLNSALIAGIVLCLFRYRRTGRLLYVYTAFLLWGLGCSNHVLMGLFLPAFLVLIVMLARQRRVNGFRPYFIMLLLFLAGSSVLIALLVRDIVATHRYLGADGIRTWLEAVVSTLDGATGGAFKEHMFASEITAGAKRFWRLNFLFLIFVNYPSVALPVGLFGFWVLWKRDTSHLLSVFIVLAIIAQAIWSANYFIWDMYAFALPVYLLLSIPIFYGIDWAFTRSKLTRIGLICLLPTVILPLVFYPAAEKWYDNGRFITRYFDNYEKIHWTSPTWKAVGYIANPNKRNYDLTGRVADRLFDVVPPGSTILTSESRLDYPMRLYYKETLGIRTDIRYLPFFGMFLTDSRASAVAQSLDRSIRGTTPTFISSLGPPDRRVLNALWLLHDPEANPETVASLSEQQFTESFPGIRFDRVDLIPEEGIYVYRLERREQSVAAGSQARIFGLQYMHGSSL